MSKPPPSFDATCVFCFFPYPPQVGALKEMGWDLNEWLPLIQDRRLLPWLVKVCGDNL